MIPRPAILSTVKFADKIENFFVVVVAAAIVVVVNHHNCRNQFSLKTEYFYLC